MQKTSFSSTARQGIAQQCPERGGPGTGKSHVATAIGVQAIEHHRRKVRFYSTVELVNALEQEKALGKAGKPLGTLLRNTLPGNG